MKNTTIWVVVIILVIIGGIWWANSSEPKEEGPIKIGVLTPLSGNIAIAGEIQKNALQLARQKVGDKNIELIFEDSKFDPRTSVSGYEALKFKGCKIIIADGSPVVASIREKAVEDGVMIFA